jgi:hypothetical protein
VTEEGYSLVVKNGKIKLDLNSRNGDDVPNVQASSFVSVVAFVDEEVEETLLTGEFFVTEEKYQTSTSTIREKVATSFKNLKLL